MDTSNQKRGKRLGCVVVTGENIEKYFTGDMTIVEGLPDDARLVDTWNEPARQRYVFMFESDEFPVVPEGETVPEVDISVVERRVNNCTHWVCPNCLDTHTNGDVKRE